MIVIAYILGALVLTGLGIAMTYLTSGWLGHKVTMWGSAVFVFFGIVVGIRHTALEGIIAAGVYAAAGYMILSAVPKLLPFFSGAAVGISLYMIVIGVLAEMEEAPRREAEQRAWEEQRAREEAAWQEEERKREADWQKYREHVATLPVATPKADIRECLEGFRTYLNRVWSKLPPELFELHDGTYELIHTWLHRQFMRIVEKQLGCRLSFSYGQYDQDYDDDLPEEETTEQDMPQSQPMEIWVNGKYELDSLVSVHDGWHHTEPPFDFVLVYEEVAPDIPMRKRYIPFDQARFELRPASWISTP